MKISANDYMDAAKERVKTARLLYDNMRFVEALYLSGVAVECVLRAYTPQNAPFDGRHDLRTLLRSATLERFVGAAQRRTIAAALGEIWQRWKNNYRYTSEDRLRAELKRLKLDRGIKGDFLKENARIAVENALTIINKGAYQWKKN